MGLLYGTRRALLGGKKPYFRKVLATGPIAYWPQNEISGLTAIDQINSPAQDGTYTGVTLNAQAGPDGQPTPFFDGVNDYNNVFSVTLRGVFDGAEGTVAAWAQMFDAGTWTDGANRRIVSFQPSGTNYIYMIKSSANNTLSLVYNAGNVAKSRSVSGLSTANWFHVAMSWSATADEARMYFNGAQQGATFNALGVWVGLLSVATTLVGSLDTGPSQPFHGYIAHPVVWDRPLTPAEIANLAVV